MTLQWAGQITSVFFTFSLLTMDDSEAHVRTARVSHLGRISAIPSTPGTDYLYIVHFCYSPSKGEGRNGEHLVHSSFYFHFVCFLLSRCVFVFCQTFRPNEQEAHRVVTATRCATHWHFTKLSCLLPSCGDSILAGGSHFWGPNRWWLIAIEIPEPFHVCFGARKNEDVPSQEEMPATTEKMDNTRCWYNHYHAR